MNALKHIRTYLLVCSLVVIFQPLQGLAQQNSDASKTSLQHPSTQRDGQHDFDFEIGTWKTHLSRLLHPLTGSATWVEYEGITVVRKVWKWPRQSGGARGRWPGRSLRRSESASVQSPIPPVEPQFCKQQRRHHEPTHDRRVQEWARRVFRPGNTEWPSHLCAICYLGHHSEFVPF